MTSTRLSDWAYRLLARSKAGCDRQQQFDHIQRRIAHPHGSRPARQLQRASARFSPSADFALCLEWSNINAMTFDEAHRCIKRGDLVSLNRALDDGLDANLTNRFAWTLLMLVAMKGNTRIAEALFAKGAKINVANDFGDTALSLAAHAGYVKLARWLLSVGASTDCRPHGHDMATWIKMSSGLPKDKLAEVLTLIGHKEHLH